VKYIEKDLPSYRLLFRPEMEAKTDYLSGSKPATTTAVTTAFTQISEL